MLGKNAKRLALTVVLGIFLVGLWGCAPVAPNAGSSQNLNPTVVVVQYVTQVVATPALKAATSTALPKSEPTALPRRIGFDPYSVQVYYPLVGCQIASRLHVGDQAVVADNRSGTLGLHMSADLGDAPIFRKLVPGEVIDIIGGPFCRSQSLVWEVLDAEQQHGYIAEGNGENYWLLPTGDGLSKESKAAIKAMKRARIKLGVPADCLPR